MRRFNYLFSIILVSLTSVSEPTLAQGTRTVPGTSGEIISDKPADTSEYILGGGDRVKISIYQSENLGGDFLILPDGTLTLPLIGRMTLKGMTIPQVMEALTKRYAAYIREPIVTVSVMVPRPLQIAIVGEVTNPGTYTIPLEQTGTAPLLTDLLRRAGGITTVADVGQVQIRRTVKGQERILLANLWELLQKGDKTQDISLRDGDSILVPTKSSIDSNETRQLADANFGLISSRDLNISVVGEVSRPGAYRITPGAASGTGGTVSGTQSQPPRLTRAIQQAGGIKPLADIRQVEIRRFNRDGSQQIIPVDLWELVERGDLAADPILQEGDQISVPTASSLSPQEAETLAAANFSPATIQVKVVGEVRRPGVVEIPPNTPLNQAILTAGDFDPRRANSSVVELIRLNPNGTVTKRSISVDFSQGINEEKNPTLRNNDVIVVNRNFLASTTDTISTIVSPIGSALGLFNIFNIFR